MKPSDLSGYNLWENQPITPCQTVEMFGVKITVKRDDLNHPIVQGNKLRKLKYNLLAAQQLNSTHVITFGGAYSNHLLATAFATQSMGLSSIGVVRGDELANRPETWSETLHHCKKLGMHLEFVSRSDYRLKTQSKAFKILIQAYPNHYILPEGGSNSLALEGVAELVEELQMQLSEPPTHLFCPVGTGGTLAGLIKGVGNNSWECKVIGVCVLKGLHGVNKYINQWLKHEDELPEYTILENYHGGGYAKNTPELIQFSGEFKQKHQIPLDKIYNNKTFYALLQMIQSGQITNSDRPLIIHTGGLQGGVNQ